MMSLLSRARLGGPVEKWIVQQTHNNFWLEASFLTSRGSERSLRRAGFARSFHDFNGFRSYLKFWSNEVCAVARIHPKTSRTGHVRVTISYYDGKGHRPREVGNALEEASLGRPLTVANSVAATSPAPSAQEPDEP